MTLSIDQKRALIEQADSSHISLARRCALLDLNRSSYYYTRKPEAPETERLMKLLDEHYTLYPHEGKIKRSFWLSEQVGYTVGKKRVSTLMKKMGIETVYPKPNTSVPNKAHSVYPYLLKDTDLIEPTQVYSSDITYIPLQGSHVYLVAIIDWFSRFVLGWELSISLEADFCVDVLKRVLATSKCDIFNTDQGSQFTSEAWLQTLLDENISISMDGRGRYLDNIFVERLWRTVKQECVYLNDFSSVTALREKLTEYFDYYNYRRLHQALGYKTPAEIHLR